MKRNSIYKQIALSLLLLVGVVGSAWGQQDTYQSVTIKHKSAENIIWYSESYKSQYGRQKPDGNHEKWEYDTFDADNALKSVSFGNESKQIQNVHEYRTVIYMFPDETRELKLPDINGDSFSLFYYQRWYDYSTDGKSSDIAAVTADASRAYTFANGLVGGAFLLDDPTTGATNNSGLYRVNYTMPTEQNETVYIACDVSIYTDIEGADNISNGITEPTLAQRAIFEIHPAIEIQNALQSSGDTWFQNDTIHFPTLDIGKTDPQVSLNMAAQNYLTIGETEDSHTTELTYTISYPTGATHTDFLTYPGNNTTSGTVSGEDRKIPFVYKTGDDGPKDGDIAYIEVKKSNYQIARFTLIFDSNTEALTLEKVKEIERKKSEDPLYYRTNAYLDSAYTCLTRLNFDYDNLTNTDTTPDFYPYPMDWKSGSYYFFTNTTTNIPNKDYPEWGGYGITNTFPICTHKPASQDSLLTDSKYHLYVDANQYPGTVCTLTLEDQLCPGACLYVTYWMMSVANSYKWDDGSVIFVLKGIDEHGNETVIHRQASGQIPYNRDTDEQHASNERYNQPPLWNQLYFTFVNGPEQYDHYVLEMQSNNASTSGADFIVDDIRVYMKKPTANVSQQKLSCGERPRLRMDISWDELISRLGLENDTTTSDKSNGIDFCFIDKKKFEEAIGESSANLTNEELAEAIKNSVINIGNAETYDKWYGTLYYDLKFDENEPYEAFTIEGEAEAAKNNPDFDPFTYGSLASNNKIDGTGEPTRYGFYYSFDDQEKKQLSVDFFANMIHGREYMLLMKDHDNLTVNYDSFGNPDTDADACTIVANFRVEGQNQIRMNGEVNDVYPDYCTGQIYTFSVSMKYYNDAGEEQEYTNNDINFDWFFGKMDDFDPEGSETTTLKDALESLRAQDKTATAIENTDPDSEQKWILGTTANLNAGEKEIIEKYLNDMSADDGKHPKLVLCESTLEIRMLENGLDLVVSPIEPETSTDATQRLCFEPMELSLGASEYAPQLQPGFEYMHYGDGEESNDAYNPAMRIGLQQIKDASEEEGKSISVNVRNVKFALAGVDGASSNYDPDHIGLLFNHEGTTPTANENNKLYLVDTNDPEYASLFSLTGENDEHKMRDYVIGTVEELEATPYEEGITLTGDFNVMKIKFNYGESMVAGSTEEKYKFYPREGYEYTFMLDFEEHADDESHDATNGTCQGNMNITMKVVPEYLVWQGKDNTKNWNNDANWKRATADQLKNGDEDYDYDDGATEEYPGYVPMLFSNVIIPKDGKIELYQAGFKGSMTEYKNMEWETTIDQLEDMEKPSISMVGDDEHPIQYDMMVFTDDDGNMSTKPYRVNLCDEIHFEPNAEMLHAELLDYNKAWVDYELEKGRWYTLASPLNGVVAGDFYTDSETGTEEQEYFTPITFVKDNNDDVDYNNDSEENNRFKPSVYQRGWKDSETYVIKGSDKNDKEDVSITSGIWSGAYNDVKEPYTPGTGFSLKVQDIDDNKTAIFRLPKADDSYSYYDATTGNTSGDAVSIDRNGEDNTDAFVSGQLITNSLKPEGTESSTKEIKVTLTQNGTNSYYLVGNPFMANLNMEQFFTTNTNLEKKYWIVTENNQEVAVGDANGLISTGTGIIAPLQSFFVQKANTANDDATVTFTADMQTLATKTDGTNTNALILTAQTADGKTSRAAIAYDMAANRDYEASEDAELFLDSNLSDVPAIYTVAGTMATSINRTSELYNIPVGIYGNSTEMVTLSFEGLNHFSSATLYDAEEKTETPLHEGTTLTVPASTSGRYFLRAGTPTANEVIETSDIQIYTLSGNRVMVTSNVPLKDIRVYTMNGAQVKHTKAGVCSFELYLPDGIYLITAQNASGETQTEKIVVR